jgi:hypothetical protein
LHKLIEEFFVGLMTLYTAISVLKLIDNTKMFKVNGRHGGNTKSAHVLPELACRLFRVVFDLFPIHGSSPITLSLNYPHP